MNGENNPFHNKILFNPYLTNFRTYYAFNFNMKEWAEIIATKFYGEGGTLTPEELSKEIVIAIKAFYSVDSYKDQKSKIFSNQSPHRILAEAFLLALLKNIRITGTKGSVNEWKNFFQEDCRKFDECDWRMSFVHAGQSSLSSSIGKISKEIAIDCFDLALNNPQELQNRKLTDYLEGFGGSKIKITAYQNGTKRNREVTKYEKIIDRTAGSEVFDINFNGVNRDVIQISSLSKNCRIISVWDIRYNPPQKLRNITKKKGLKITEISEFNPGRKISIESIAYSADTKKNTEIRLDKSEVK